MSILLCAGLLLGRQWKSRRTKCTNTTVCQERGKGNNLKSSKLEYAIYLLIFVLSGKLVFIFYFGAEVYFL